MSDAPPNLTVGIFGKLPSRGDFVRIGLPGDFVGTWDAWAQRMLSETQDRLADQWEAIWNAAPVWRFAMPPGACGAGAALGVMMPSVDRVGRYFPLAIAAVLPSLSGLAFSAGDLPDCLEQAGRDALNRDLSPEDMMLRIDTALTACVATDPCDVAPGWWTDGTPGFAPILHHVEGLPDAALRLRLLVEAEPDP